MRKGLVCVAVPAKDAESVAAAVQPVRDLVDVVEIRLDAMRSPQVRKCRELLTLPLLFTHRPDWEGGEFHGSEKKRVQPLYEAIEVGAEFIDFELNAERSMRRDLLDALAGTTTKMIISCHDFRETPPADHLQDILHEQMASGAHIGKIVTVAHSPFDVLRVLNLLEEAAKNDFPLCAFCMGEMGKISRLATIFFGGFMTYGALNEAQATAPGQLSIVNMRKLLKVYKELLGSGTDGLAD